MPVAVHDPLPRTVFPGLLSGSFDPDRPPVPAIWTETSFEILTVRKGDAPEPHLVLHHLKWGEAPNVLSDPPQFVSFEIRRKKRYLLFLRCEGERWVPLTGQIDPIYGVKDLGTYP